MSQDQAASGYSDDEHRSTGWLFILGAAVCAALLSLAAHHHSNAAAPSPPAPSPFPQPTPVASPSASVSASVSASASVSGRPSFVARSADPTAAMLAQIGGYVTVGEVCSPITDGRTTLTVRFLLRNATGLPEQLVKVVPELPMGGLVPRGTLVQGGTCADPAGTAAAPKDNRMAANGGTQIVSLRFALPKSCPAPYPVQAVVTIGIGGVQRQDSIVLFSDLGSVKFDLCTSRPTP